MTKLNDNDKMVLVLLGIIFGLIIIISILIANLLIVGALL